MTKIFKPGTEEIIKETVAVVEAIECDICGKKSRQTAKIREDILE